MAAASAAAELAGENGAGGEVAEGLCRPEEELCRRSPAAVEDSATEPWRVGEDCGNLTGDWPRNHRILCTRGMDMSRGKSRSSMGAATSIAAKRASSHLTNVVSSMQESKNWSVSARMRMTYRRLGRLAVDSLV